MQIVMLIKIIREHLTSQRGSSIDSLVINQLFYSTMMMIMTKMMQIVKMVKKLQKTYVTSHNGLRLQFHYRYQPWWLWWYKIIQILRIIKRMQIVIKTMQKKLNLTTGIRGSCYTYTSLDGCDYANCYDAKIVMI